MLYIHLPTKSEEQDGEGSIAKQCEKKKPNADKNKKKSAPAASPFTSARIAGKDARGRKF
jgi:hypothetical protein